MKSSLSVGGEHKSAATGFLLNVIIGLLNPQIASPMDG